MSASVGQEFVAIANRNESVGEVLSFERSSLSVRGLSAHSTNRLLAHRQPYAATSFKSAADPDIFVELCPHGAPGNHSHDF